jgi:hypothetical protein
MKHIVNQKELVQELDKVLDQCDGEVVAELCNKVMHEVKYLGGTQYEIDDGMPDEPELDPRWTKTI